MKIDEEFLLVLAADLERIGKDRNSIPSKKIRDILIGWAETLKAIK